MNCPLNYLRLPVSSKDKHNNFVVSNIRFHPVTYSIFHIYFYKGGIHAIEATQGFDADGAKITVNPRYNLDTEEGDVVINYDAGDTNVELTASASAQSVKIEHQAGDTNFEVNASADAQSVTISQKLDDDNRIAPTITSNGDISVEWERNLGDDNSLSATIKPNDAIDLEWKDSDWTANINLPIDGTTITGANVGIKRDVSF